MKGNKMLIRILSFLGVLTNWLAISICIVFSGLPVSLISLLLFNSLILLTFSFYGVYALKNNS